MSTGNAAMIGIDKYGLLGEDVDTAARMVSVIGQYGLTKLPNYSLLMGNRFRDGQKIRFNEAAN